MRGKILLLLLLLFAAAFPLLARDVAVTVVDAELDLPLEGAVVRSWDGRQYTCDEAGMAQVSLPDDRTVVIQAAYPGYENARLAVTPGVTSCVMSLRLTGIMEGRELVIEAARPGTNETKTGRSVAVSGREIAQTAEIGIIEDVMSSIKLLPGVGYTGLFNAQPSIRGGDPGDLRASLDGFYVFNPYHWGGGFSIFDPRMVESAQLSHGVFSSRYGHTISGLLDITSKRPSPTETEFELGVNTSAANFNLSIPLAGKGGLLFMGRLTYYDPVVALAKQLSKAIPEIEIINSVRVAPYIRNGTITGNYRFSDALELKATGFWGMDGVGASYENSSHTSAFDSDTYMDFDWTNYQGFITAGLSWNPRNDMLLKFTSGAGYEKAVVDGDMRYNILGKSYLPTSSNAWYYQSLLTSSRFSDSYDFVTRAFYQEKDLMANAQGRIDYDWELGRGFLLAAGAQEMFTYFSSKGSQQMNMEKNFSDFDSATQDMLFNDMGITDPAAKELFRQYLIISIPLKYNPNAENKLFTTSGYSLIEYHTPNNRFKTELGMRVDHFYLQGKGFSLQSNPALNPRLNLDFNVFKGSGFVQSLDLSAGTGLFSSVNNNVIIAEEQYKISEIKPDRSLTSILGVRLELPDGLLFNIEGYYKHVFNRMYIPITAELESLDIQPQSNGKGKIWGIDLMLQKLQSRYWDGWLSYSFNWAKYRDPSSGNSDMGISGGTRGDDWYFPSFHRFHNLNLIFNLKPAARFNIYTRFGFASGVQLMRRVTSEPRSYPVYVYDSDDPANNQFIEMYKWPSVRDEKNRTTPSLPLDIKFSVFGKNNAGKVRYEVYAAVENVLALLYTAQGNTSFNSYTGEVMTGSMSAVYEMPIPVPSFGIKFTY